MKEGMTFSDWYRVQLHYSDTLVYWCWKRMIYKTEEVWHR